jgi:hypothetical protein
MKRAKQLLQATTGSDMALRTRWSVGSCITVLGGIARADRCPAIHRAKFQPIEFGKFGWAVGWLAGSHQGWCPPAAQRLTEKLVASIMFSRRNM